MTKVTVKLRYLRHSPRKLRPYFANLRLKSLPLALNQVAVINSDAGRYLHQLLKSAEAAGRSKELSPEDLIISQVFAVDGPRIKRVRATARGRASHYAKRLSHLVIELDSRPKDATGNTTKEKNGPKD